MSESARIKTSDVLFFFGAGASAAFGIPTMKQFVKDFEDFLTDEAPREERVMYSDIKSTLEDQLSADIDLEAVFTVIDGILDYTVERLGLLSLYAATGFKKPFPNRHSKEICRNLRRKFQQFVKRNCAIPEDSFPRIGLVYRDFFNRFALELKRDDISFNKDYAWQNDWTFFTTNYDTCLEYYWRQVARVALDTGFEFDNTRSVKILRSEKFLQTSRGLQLFKLHGSVTWFVERGTGDIIDEEMVGGRSHMGRKFVREMMIYPVAEKQLYLDPYISMLLRLNQELERRSVWVVVGYSFNDPIIREIFLRKSAKRKDLILVHPRANEVFNERLLNAKSEFYPMEKEFGLEGTFRQVNHQIIHKLKEEPRYDWRVTPLPV